MLKTLGRKWAALKIFAGDYPQKDLLKRLQNEYCSKLKLNNGSQSSDIVGMLANTFLETDDSGIPKRGISLNEMQVYQSYTSTGPLVCYANMLQSQIMQYLVARQDKYAVYSNDVNSIFCMQMLHDFEKMFVASGMSMSEDLLAQVKAWKNLVGFLKADGLGDRSIFSLHEEFDPGQTLLVLLANICELFGDIEREIKFELSRRTVADHLNNLAQDSKSFIGLQFEYISTLLTCEAIPLDFTLVCLYNKNINSKLHQQFYGKSWFKPIYHFASCDAIRHLFFDDKPIHIEIQKIMGTPSQNNSKELIDFVNKAPFLMLEGKVNTNAVNSVLEPLENPKTKNQTGLHAFFMDEKNRHYVNDAICLLGKLEVLANLTKLIRIASFLLHQDGSLLAQEDTKSQLVIFIEIYQKLILEIEKLTNRLHGTLDAQQQLQVKNDGKVEFRNPNQVVCLSLKNDMDTLQDKCKKDLGHIKGLVENFNEHRKILNDLLKWFKQEWFTFVGQHHWLLTPEQQQQLLGTGGLDVKRLTSSVNSRPILKLTLENPIPMDALKMSLDTLLSLQKHKNTEIIYIDSFVAFSDPSFMKIRLSSLKINQRFLCLISSSPGYALLAIEKLEDAVRAVFVDTLGGQDNNKKIQGFCAQHQMTYSPISESIPINFQEIYIYEIVKLLLTIETVHNKQLWEKILAQGLLIIPVLSLKKYQWAIEFQRWHSSQLNPSFQSIEHTIIVPKQLILPENYLTISAIEDLLKINQKMELVLPISNESLNEKDIYQIVKTYPDRIAIAHQGHILKLNWGVNLIDIMKQWICMGICQPPLWDALILAAKTKHTNLNIPIEKKGTLLHYAIEKQQPKIAAYLIQHCTNVINGIDKNILDENQRSPLDIFILTMKDKQLTSEDKEFLKVCLKANVSGTPENIKLAELKLKAPPRKAIPLREASKILHRDSPLMSQQQPKAVEKLPKEETAFSKEKKDEFIQFLTKELR